MKKSILLSLGIMSLGVNAGGLQEVAYPGFIEVYEKAKISTEKYDSASFENLAKYVDSKLAKIEASLKALEEKDDNGKLSKVEEDQEELDELSEDYYKMAKALLTKTSASSSFADKNRYYMTALRAIYSIESIYHAEQLQKVNIFEKGSKLLATIPNLLGKLDTNIPYIQVEDRNNPVGSHQASLESSYLYDTKANKFVSKSELADLSHNQIANLDVSADHPAWYQESTRKSMKDAWGELEAWANKNQAKEVMKKIEKDIRKDLQKEDPSLSKDEVKELAEEEVAKLEKYEMHKARRVLFMSKIKDTATSPKINTKDAYGEKWKLKWGNEISTEPVGNRLAMKLGAKFADLVYANEAGPQGVVLVLEEKDDLDSCDNIDTYSTFQRCMLESVYEFNVNPYTMHSGTITEKNAEVILANLSNSGKKKYKKENLIGRDYVTFKESMVEFKSDRIMTRGGASAGSFLGADQDRAMRGNLIFSGFIKNIDQKDINSRTAIVKELFPGQKKSFVEFTHDFGASMGNPGKSLLVNGLGYNNGGILNKYDFLKYDSFNIKSKANEIIIDQFLLYRPAAWNKSTFADNLWMAKKIVSLTKKDFEEVADATLWPGYMKRALVQRFRLRRNIVADYFDIKYLIPKGEETIPPLNISYSLKTKEDRVKAVADFKQYGLTLNFLERVLENAGKLKSNGKSKHKEDKLIDDNEVTSCEKSAITYALEIIRYPSGLADRQKRSKDNVSLKCDFKGTGWF